jgi:D-alanine transaminase
MPRLSYVNGRIVSVAEARVSVEDRGYQFADSVYEVCAVLNGRLLDWDAHVERLHASLAALSIRSPMTAAALRLQAERLILASQLRQATLYLQVTRGVARRDHPFPRDTRPSLVMTVRPFDFRQRLRQQADGVAVLTLPDERWARCDIKSTSLLPNVLAKQAARSAGAFEAWLVGRDRRITEGASTNAWIVGGEGKLITHPLSSAVLPGVMRATLIRLAAAAGLAVEERMFTLDEARTAPEAFLTSTTAPCLPVVSIDGSPVGDGRPGPATRRAIGFLREEVARQTGWRA